MDINDAIKHCKDVAKSNRKLFDMCPHTPENEKCATEHEELAGWLEELIKLRKFIEDNKLLYEVDIEDVVKTMSPLAGVSCITWYNILKSLQKAGYIICEKK